MKTLLAAAALALLVSAASPGSKMSMNEMTAETYEHLATAIIAIRATEDDLVKGILVHARAMAQNYLTAALGATGSARTSQLEKAASEITDIANEGNKSIQAIRQRLLKAGHLHNTDAATQGDYMFVNSGEKAELVALARKVSKLTADSDIRQAAKDLDALFDRVIAGD